MTVKKRKAWPWIVVGTVVLLLIPVVWLVVPILTHTSQGQSNQADTGDEWPTRVSAHGDDGRTRELSVRGEDAPMDTSAVTPGQRIVVTGSGFDASRGIYVAVCAIVPASERPHPCLGGVPEQTESESDAEAGEGAIQWAPSNWINDDWAWKLFGARGYDDPEAGTFTAYLELPDAADENLDCRVTACAIYSRNDHTALGDRVQDLHIPIAFAE